MKKLLFDYSNTFAKRNSQPGTLPLTILFLLTLSASAAVAQSSATESTSCVLKNHIYTCDKASFQTALTNAKTAAVETHSVDKLAQAQLSDLITKKLGKTLAPDGGPTDLIFLLIPVGVEGMSMSPGDVNVGTLRIYSANSDGTRAHLLWAEDFFGSEDMPWPTVVHGLILQFQSHFHIK
jgi:hypothetical protein